MADYAGFVSGGQGVCDFFRLKLKSDKSGYDFLDKLTNTIAPTPTKANAALSITKVINKTKLDYQDDGTVKYDLTQYEAGSLFWKFLDLVAVPIGTDSISKSAVTLEHGVKKAATTASGGSTILAVYYGFNDGTDEIFTISAFATVASSSGSTESDAENYTKPTLALTGIISEATAATSGFSLPKGIFDSSIITVATDPVIPKNWCFTRGFFPKTV
jgi:hypothetical protein